MCLCVSLRMNLLVCYIFHSPNIIVLLISIDICVWVHRSVVGRPTLKLSTSQYDWLFLLKISSLLLFCMSVIVFLLSLEVPLKESDSSMASPALSNLLFRTTRPYNSLDPCFLMRWPVLKNLSNWGKTGFCIMQIMYLHLMMAFWYGIYLIGGEWNTFWAIFVVSRSNCFTSTFWVGWSLVCFFVKLNIVVFCCFPADEEL